MCARDIVLGAGDRAVNQTVAVLGVSVPATGTLNTLRTVG